MPNYLRWAALSLLCAIDEAVLAQGTGCQFARITHEPPRRLQLGQSVACSSSRLLVGVPGIAETWGAAYLLNRTGTSIEAVLTPAGATQGIGFGGSAACFSPNGTLAFVGARYEIVDSFVDGSVYVFERDSLLEWVQTAKITAQQPDRDAYEYDYFGGAMAYDAGTLLVGAYNDTSAYIFDRDAEGVWAQTARLTPSPYGWYFGYAVAIKGDTAVIGAPNDFTQGQWAGAAFVFERNEFGEWVQTARLLPDFGHQQNFGWAIAAGPDVILVGVPHDNTHAPAAGSVYVFSRDAAGSWATTQRLYSPDPENSDFFGVSVVIDGDVAIIGAENVGGVFFGYGAAFVFQRGTDGVWRHLETLMANDPHDGSEFGRVVALSGNVAVIGAPFQDEVDAEGNLIERAGAAYVFAVGPDSDDNGVMDVCECRAVGDLTLDGAIDFQDLILVLSSFALDEGGDLDADGDTDLQDLANLLANFGSPCPQ